MKIAVNTRLLLKNQLEGIGWFTYESLKRITQNHKEHQFVFIFDRPYDESFIFSDNITPLKIGPPARHPILWYWWFEHSIPKALKKCGADVFVSTDGYGSLNAQLPSYLVIHDLAFEHFPKHLKSPHRNFMQKYTPKYAHSATRIGTVSEFSKEDIAQKYNVAHDKIDVLYNGSNDACNPFSNEEKSEIKSRFTQGQDYFLFLSAIHPRKNLDNLLKAFDQFKENNSNQVKLLVAGRKAWNNNGLDEVFNAMKFKDDVVWTGHLQKTEVGEVLGASLSLVYPSHFEGFGIPILEAMHVEVPVITSNVSSMPEVAGDAAILVEPSSVDSIYNALNAIYKDQNLRFDLVNKGKEQRQQFSWNKTADKLWDGINRILPPS